MIDYLSEKCGFSTENIILFGRSIGTGPAVYAAGRRPVGGLILMSPYTSIRAVVKHIVGSVLQYAVAERFMNVNEISKVECPTLFVHGKLDELIPYQHSLELHKNCICSTEVVLPDHMTHNEFNIFNDLLYPMARFLRKNGIRVQKDDYYGKVWFPAEVHLKTRETSKYRRERSAMGHLYDRVK